MASERGHDSVSQTPISSDKGVTASHNGPYGQFLLIADANSLNISERIEYIDCNAFTRTFRPDWRAGNRQHRNDRRQSARSHAGASGEFQPNRGLCGENPPRRSSVAHQVTKPDQWRPAGCYPRFGVEPLRRW